MVELERPEPARGARRRAPAGCVIPFSRSAASKPASANPSTAGAGQVKGMLTSPDAPARRSEPVPERRGAPVAAVDEAEPVAGLVALGEVPDAVPACIDAGHERRPRVRGERVRRRAEDSARFRSRGCAAGAAARRASISGSMTSNVAASRPMTRQRWSGHSGLSLSTRALLRPRQRADLEPSWT